MISDTPEITINKASGQMTKEEMFLTKDAIMKQNQKRRKRRTLVFQKKVKIVVLGDERAGKTSIAKRLCLAGLSDYTKMNAFLFDWKEQMTIRAMHYQRKEYLGPMEDHELTIDIWDTPGQERYKAIN